MSVFALNTSQIVFLLYLFLLSFSWVFWIRFEWVSRCLSRLSVCLFACKEKIRTKVLGDRIDLNSQSNHALFSPYNHVELSFVMLELSPCALTHALKCTQLTKLLIGTIRGLKLNFVIPTSSIVPRGACIALITTCLTLINNDYVEIVRKLH